MLPPVSPNPFRTSLTGVVAAIALLIATAPSPVSGQARIRELDRRDPVYAQHQAMVSAAHTTGAVDGSAAAEVPLVLFSYAIPDGADLYDIAARLMLPYSTVATINRLSSPDLPAAGAVLLIPNQPGLFVPTDGDGDLERRIAARIAAEPATRRVRIPADNGTVPFLYAPGADFTPAERDTFHRIRFVRPLRGGTVSSRYGYRNHPVTGVRSYHAGIDLSAPFGTPVRAAADGVVTAIDREPWLGLSVTVAHRQEYATVYAHLQEVTVPVGHEVARGDMLGAVGSTGMSTGPHLHFEIRYRGEPRDPERYVAW